MLLCTAKSTEPHPGWSQAGAAGNDADAADAAAHALGHAAHQQAEQGVHDDDRQQPCDDKGHDGAGLLDDLSVVFHALRVEPGLQIVV